MRCISMNISGLAVAALALAPCVAAAQSFPLSPDEVADSSALSRSMPRLAEQVLAGYREDNRARYLDNVLRMQVITGKFPDAQSSIAELQALRARQDSSAQARARFV